MEPNQPVRRDFSSLPHIENSQKECDQASKVKERSPWHPKSWTWEKWLLGTLFCICAIIGAVVGSILGSRLNAYPNYYKINYRLKDMYSGTTFFTNFDTSKNGTLTSIDTKSFILSTNEVPITPANKTLSTNNTTAIVRVNTATENPTNTHSSIQFTSKARYTTGLFIFDALHVPYSCTTRPILRLTDPHNWPINGEIDIIQAQHTRSEDEEHDDENQVALRTTPGCRIGKNRRRRQTGDALSYDCSSTSAIKHRESNANETKSNIDGSEDFGCAVRGPRYSSVPSFNKIGGAIYTVEVRNEGIRIWMFPQTRVPNDLKPISSAANVTGEGYTGPNPSGWGAPVADFPNMECKIGDFFRELRIVVGIEVGFGNGKVRDESECGEGMELEAYWEFGGIWAYETSG